MYSIPTRFYIESDAVKNHAAEISAFGKRAFIVTGKHSSVQNGSLDDVKEVLENFGKEYLIFNDTEENPSVETCFKAASYADAFGADHIIAVGGGSPMDAAKAVSVLVAGKVCRRGNVLNERDGTVIPSMTVTADELRTAEKFLYTPSVFSHLPVICVPTTAGTGSEVTPVSVITSHIRGTKKSIAHRFFPSLALADPRYLKTVSYKSFVNTAVDTLAHLAESYLARSRNDLSTAYAAKGLELWGENKLFLINEKEFEKKTDEDLTRFMTASLLGGLSIAYTGTSLPHSLSYLFTYEKHLEHGRAVGIFLPGFMEYHPDFKSVRIINRLLGFKDAEELCLFLNKIFPYSSIDENLRNKAAAAVMSDKAKLKQYGYPVNSELLKKIYDFYYYDDLFW